MILKNIFKIHILFYVVGLISALTGYFNKFIIFSSIIIIHELGHILAAIIFKWKIEKIILLPFGGITIFNERIDKPLYQEFLIAIMGPLFQVIFFLIYRNNSIFSAYNKFILIFNLLPIYPLDGSKIVNVLLNILLPFKISHILILIISIITIILFSINNLTFFLIIIFIIIEIIKEFLKHKYYFNKFLLERYMYDDNFKKSKIIKKITNMKRQTNNHLLINRKIIKERDFIKNMFDK